MDEKQHCSAQAMLEITAAFAAAKNAVPEIEVKDGFPSYPSDIETFMALLLEPPWVAFDYDPFRTQEILDRVSEASFEDIRKLLTAIQRAERFCDGAWKASLEDGSIERIVARLEVLCLSR